MKIFRNLLTAPLVLLTLMALAACGGKNTSDSSDPSALKPFALTQSNALSVLESVGLTVSNAASALQSFSLTESSVPSASAGQVNNSRQTAPVSNYAAARMAEQVSFGATPTLRQDIQGRGLEAWINYQASLPISQMQAPSWVIDFNDNNQAERDRAWRWISSSLVQFPLTGDDQLRQRVAWALLQFANTQLALVIPAQHPPHIGFTHPQAEAFGDLKLHRDGTRSCYVADPSGNPVEVLAPIEP